MTIYDLKPAFQNLLRPICRALAGAGVTANQVTLAAVLLSFASGAAIGWKPGAAWPLWCLPAVLLVRMALNAIDGMLAREHGQQSALGGLLNELGDVVSDTAIFLPFALIPGVRAAAVVGVVLLAVFSEMTGVVAVQIGASRRYDGPLGKSDRAFVFAVLAMVLAAGVTPGRWLDIVWGFAAVLLVWTCWNRGRRALTEVRAKTAAT